MSIADHQAKLELPWSPGADWIQVKLNDHEGNDYEYLMLCDAWVCGHGRKSYIYIYIYIYMVRT